MGLEVKVANKTGVLKKIAQPNQLLMYVDTYNRMINFQDFVGETTNRVNLVKITIKNNSQIWEGTFEELFEKLK